MLKRNFNYNVGNIDYNLDGTRLVCKVAGTTSSDPIVIGGGAELVDGTVTWQVIDDSDMPSEIYETIPYTSSSTTSWSTINYKPVADGYLYLSVATYGTDIEGTITLWSDAVDVRNFMSQTCVSGGDRREMGITMCVAGDRSCRIGSINCNSVAACRFIYSIKSAKKLGLL